MAQATPNTIPNVIFKNSPSCSARYVNLNASSEVLLVIWTNQQKNIIELGFNRKLCKKFVLVIMTNEPM